MSDRNSALTGATTYQAIVIALVAAGIISIGVMSVCYRRRRREQWEQTVRAGLDRARYRHGFGDLPGGGGADDGVDLGEKPVLWDMDIGGEGDDWAPIRVGMDPDDNLPNGKPPEYNVDVEMTILIAMPQPPFTSRQTAPTPRRHSSSSTSLRSVNLKAADAEADPFTLSDLPHYQATQAEVDSEELPHLEIGTTCVPLRVHDAEEREQLQELRLGQMGSRAGIAGDWGRTDTTGR